MRQPARSLVERLPISQFTPSRDGELRYPWLVCCWRPGPPAKKSTLSILGGAGFRVTWRPQTACYLPVLRHPRPGCYFAVLSETDPRPRRLAFTSDRGDCTLGFNGLAAVRRDRIQNADPGGWFLCVAIPPRSGPFYTQSPAMLSDRATEHSNGPPALARYERPSLFPHRVHRILDTTTRMGDALRRIGCDRHPDAARFHRICAVVWLFRVRIAFGQYWRVARRGKRTEIHHRLHHLHQIVVSCYDSALVKMAKTTPFRDVRADERLADETWRSDPAVFDQARYPFLTDEELASITRGLERRAFKIYCYASDLRNALWEQLDRLHKFPRLRNTATAGGVDTLVRSDSWRDVAPWREKVAYQFRSTSEAKAQGEDRTLEAPATGPLVILGKPGDQPIVNGNITPRLTLARYHIIKALIDAAEKGLTGDELVNKSGHGGAVNTLKAMARDRDWGAVIQLPGSSGGRYRIVSRLDGD